MTGHKDLIFIDQILAGLLMLLENIVAGTSLLDLLGTSIDEQYHVIILVSSQFYILSIRADLVLSQFVIIIALCNTCRNL